MKEIRKEVIKEGMKKGAGMATFIGEKTLLRQNGKGGLRKGGV